jgi:hypothetical protein
VADRVEPDDVVVSGQLHRLETMVTSTEARVHRYFKGRPVTT